MRRLTGLVLSALLVLTLLVAPAAASPAAAATDGAIVLAVEEGEPLGPNPQERLQEDNRARELAGYEDPETPFTWGAAWILTFAGLVGLVLLGGLYYLLVHRPAQQEDAGRR